MDITELLAFSVKHNASDLHLSAGVAPMVRVDGDVRKLSLPALSHQEVNQLVLDVMNDNQQREFQAQLEVDFSFHMQSVGRFRVNAFHQQHGCAAVFRVIPETVPSLADLHAPEIFADFAQLSNGLVLVTGPTGSGKSTTLAAMVDHINRHAPKHILTIEDPIEFIHHPQQSLINQREVKRDTLSFQQALRSALREDPDVILVGELRDLDTISLALTAAETGHLVFGTLHTSSAAKTVDRIIDVFPGSDKPLVRSMLSASLRAVVSQQLIKTAQGGRVAAHEIMIASPAIRNLIREDKVAQMVSMIQTGSNQGMQTMEQALADLVGQGTIAPEQRDRVLRAL
ncbi:twitching motility protein PilT [Salinivibrio proteolyticus]|uniref:type IV pilus twitching motility protein PilT n=1 Tax=Salinivibrio proteolyticus TaxID=334715 RepID=UPI0009889ECC|nr:type IV pilus twitching motility protein PilT [Salinivibrio proteolyticus]OOF25856.1 twitching motility protein PilT [Salinivibrio proteolyticus]OOF29919.1 twitching motility protein PilT [Salinivibrio proteolyticus]